MPSWNKAAAACRWAVSTGRPRSTRRRRSTAIRRPMTRRRPRLGSRRSTDADLQVVDVVPTSQLVVAGVDHAGKGRRVVLVVCRGQFGVEWTLDRGLDWRLEGRKNYDGVWRRKRNGDKLRCRNNCTTTSSIIIIVTVPHMRRTIREFSACVRLSCVHFKRMFYGRLSQTLNYTYCWIHRIWMCTHTVR